MKNFIITLSFLLFVNQAHAIQFNFMSIIFGAKRIKDFGTYKAYANGKVAKSCYDYKNSATGYMYAGDVGNGAYKITQPNGNSSIVYCDMTTDGGGWTLVIFDAGSTGNNSTTTMRAQGDAGYLDTSVYLRSTTSTPQGAKYSTANIIDIAQQKEFLIQDSSNLKFIIKYANDISSAGFSLTGMTNWAFSSKDSSGIYQTGCNGHYNIRGITVYSDFHNSICPYVYSGTATYAYHSKHVYCGTGSAGAYYADYCYPGGSARPIYVFVR